MAKFTIARAGQTITEVTLTGERIELGSAKSCQLFIDDLLIALKQVVFVRIGGGDTYRLESLTDIPKSTLDGSVVSAPVDLDDGAVLHVEGYDITIEYSPAEAEAATPQSVATPQTENKQQGEASSSGAPSLPPPLEPDLPALIEPEKPAPLPPVAVAADRNDKKQDDMDRTVYIRKVGRLIATDGPLKGQSWDLLSGETPIGRDAKQNRIVLRLDAKGVVDTSISRRHASVFVDNDLVTLEDKGSAAGTFVNQRQVSPGEKVALQHGDTIEIRSARQSTYLRLELNHPPATAPPSLPPEPLAPLQPPPPPPSAPPALESPPPLAPLHDPAPAFDPVAASADAEWKPPHDTPGHRPSESMVAPQRTLDDNPFLPSAEPRGMGGMSKWTLIGIALAVIFVAGFMFLWLY